MKTRRHFPGAVLRALLCAPLVALAYAAVTHSPRGGPDAHAAGATRKAGARGQGEGRVDIRLRSLTTRATGRLTLEPSEAGGRARLTTLNLPDPRTVTPGARTYIVWALSGGRILRLGELKVDARGNGGLAFERPEGFERYGVIVTAESSAEVERPGDPVLTTRADEAAALYPAPAETGANTSPRADSAGAERSGAPAAAATPDATPAPVRSGAPDDRATNAAPANARAASGRTGTGVSAPSASPSRGGAARGAFYSEVEDAIAASGGGRVIEMEGDGAASGASGAARAAYRSGRAYVRASFRGVPLPSAVGAGVYVLWGVLSDGRIVYMGSLPATEDLNRAEVYVRVAGFDADDYTLFVTAEAARPAPTPAPRRVLRPRNASFVIQ